MTSGPGHVPARRSRSPTPSERLRESAPDVEFLYQFYVVDEKRRLIGLVNMRRLFLGKETDLPRDVMAPWTICVHPDGLRRPRSRAVIEKYNLAAVPVVDAEGVARRR